MLAAVAPSVAPSVEPPAAALIGLLAGVPAAAAALIELPAASFVDSAQQSCASHIHPR